MVRAHIEKLTPEVAEIVFYLRQVVLSADAQISEQIKWNSPSFYYHGEMKPFDPKTYKRDIVVFNIRKERILLVFPTGAAIKNNGDLLEGNYSDGRRTLNIKSLEDAQAKTMTLQQVILEWMETVEK